jgi:hypothetical protein
LIFYVNNEVSLEGGLIEIYLDTGSELPPDTRIVAAILVVAVRRNIMKLTRKVQFVICMTLSSTCRLRVPIAIGIALNGKAW